MSMRTTSVAAILGLVLGAGSVAAQIGPGPDNPAAPAKTTSERNDEPGFGWIGVFGLLGALGLVGARNRTSSREHDFAGGRSTATNPTRH